MQTFTFHQSYISIKLITCPFGLISTTISTVCNATRNGSRKSVSWTQKHSTLSFLKTDIAFIVSFEVHRINDGSSPKVISKPRGNSVYLTVVLDAVVVSKYRLVNIDAIRNKKNNIPLVRKTFYRTSIHRTEIIY